MKNINILIFGLLTYFLDVHALIVPDELPSLLSVIYSNIPTIKKGTDSRYGWGFRLGNRADFQVLVELGPQLNTQPLRQIPGSRSNKRSTVNNLRNALFAQQQEKKQESNKDVGWLNTWKQEMMNVKQMQIVPSGAKPGLGIGEIDAKSVIPDDTTWRLQDLYKLAKTTSTEASLDR